MQIGLRPCRPCFWLFILLSACALLERIEGAACPVRAVLVPEKDTGLLGTDYPRLVQFYDYYVNGSYDDHTSEWRQVFRPSPAHSTCCPSGRIVEWQISGTSRYNLLGEVGFRCSDAAGYMDQTIRVGFNGTVNGSEQYCPTNVNSAVAVHQPDEEGVFPFSSDDIVQSFLGVGHSHVSWVYQSVAATCPPGTRAIGIQARSSCYALTAVKVVCSVVDAVNNTGPDTEPATQCSAQSVVPSLSSGISLGNPQAWNCTSNTTFANGDLVLEQLASTRSAPLQQDCCKPGEGIKRWILGAAGRTIPQTLSPYRLYSVGALQGECTDGKLLTHLVYGAGLLDGSNSTFVYYYDQSLPLEFQYFTPADQKYYYTLSDQAARGSGQLVSFIFPPANDSRPEIPQDSQDRPYIQCPPGQAAVGYSAQSGTYSLTNVTVLCGVLSESANASLAAVASPTSNPPYEATAGICPGGVRLIPSYTYPNNIQYPIGQRSSFTYKSKPGDKIQLNGTLYSGNAGPLQSVCCSGGHGIVSFDVWPTEALNLVGAIRIVCSDGNTSPILSYGFNSTNQNGSALFCTNTTRDMQNIALDKGEITYSGNEDGFLSLLGWPNRTDSDFLGPGKQTNFSCPDGLVPIGASVRSSCFQLVDFKVTCGVLSDSAKASLAAIAAAASRFSNASTPSDKATAGICPGGVKIIPNDTYAETGGFPIGQLSRSTLESRPGDKFQLNRTLYSGASGPFQSACCSKGRRIVSFNVWPTEALNLVGAIQLVCSDKKTSPILSYGFNSTNLNGSALFCTNTTRAMKNVAFNQGNITYSGGKNAFLSLLGWPNRTESDYLGAGSQHNFSCPDGLVPVGAGVRSSCFQLVDFKVICGDKAAIDFVTESDSRKSNSSLEAGAIAGITVGILVGAAGILLLAGFIVFRRFQEYKRGEEDDYEDDLIQSGKSTGETMSIVPYTDVRGSGSRDVVRMDDVDLPDGDISTTSFDNLPEQWKIPLSDVKLVCRGDRVVVLGSGGCGIVYHGLVRREEAAIKMVKGGHPSEQARLLHEILILERCRSSYVVQFLGYAISDDGLLLCMEFLSGGTLYESLKRETTYQWYNRGCEAMQSIARGLFSLHRQSMVHLDLKSPNVLIASDGRVKIADLGLGKMVKGVDTKVSQIATLHWMAPENWRGRAGSASDVWAFGTILWEVCTLRKPYMGLDITEIIVPTHAPAELVSLIRACRAEDPTDRPTMGEICDMLEVISQLS